MLDDACATSSEKTMQPADSYINYMVKIKTKVGLAHLGPPVAWI